MIKIILVEKNQSRSTEHDRLIKTNRIDSTITKSTGLYFNLPKLIEIDQLTKLIDIIIEFRIDTTENVENRPKSIKFDTS